MHLISPFVTCPTILRALLLSNVRVECCVPEVAQHSHTHTYASDKSPRINCPCKSTHTHSVCLSNSSSLCLREKANRCVDKNFDYEYRRTAYLCKFVGSFFMLPPPFVQRSANPFIRIQHSSGFGIVSLFAQLSGAKIEWKSHLWWFAQKWSRNLEIHKL